MQERKNYVRPTFVRRLLATLVILLAAFAVAPGPVALATETLPIGGDGRVDPADFRVTVFASGLDYPYGMVELADGSILVASSDPDVSNLFESTGQLIRFVDADANGVADDAGTVLFTGLPATVTGLAVAGDLVFVASSALETPGISVLRLGTELSDPLTLIGSIDLAYPDAWSHRTTGFAVREAAGGGYELYFNVGSELDAATSASTVAVSGLLTGSVVGESIYRVTIADTAGVVTIADLTLIATGLRNAAALTFHPVSGALYFVDNGMSTPDDPDDTLATDELNAIAAADLGGDVEDFGFADNYVEYRTGTIVGGAGVAPEAVFQPLQPGGLESEGPAGLAFAPSRFPAGLNDGVFVGFHGKNVSGAANEENPLVYLDANMTDYFHFVSTLVPDVGHLDNVLSTNDSLFVADLASVGSLFGGAGQGVIYQVKSLNPGPVGYRLLEADGTVYSCGDTSGLACTQGDSGRIEHFGDAYDPGESLPLGVTAVAMDTTPSGQGYVILLSNGEVVARGDAPVIVAALAPDVSGSLTVIERPSAISLTASGTGYWVFTNVGRALSFNAGFSGDLPTIGVVPDGVVVASVATANDGYYMLGEDGGVFAFGDAPFRGSIPQILPGIQLACPVVGLVPTPNNDGYWMVACDGGVFSFGAAPFLGSLPQLEVFVLAGPIVGMVAFGDGYLMVGSDGGAFIFGAPFFGSLGDNPPDTPIVAID